MYLKYFVILRAKVRSALFESGLQKTVREEKACTGSIENSVLFFKPSKVIEFFLDLYTLINLKILNCVYTFFEIHYSN